MFYVYILQDGESRVYTGISNNLERRLGDHNNQRGANFTKSGNFKIVFKEGYLTLKEARQREIQIKKWRKVKKEALIERYKLGITTKL